MTFLVVDGYETHLEKTEASITKIAQLLDVDWGYIKERSNNLVIFIVSSGWIESFSDQDRTLKTFIF